MKLSTQHFQRYGPLASHRPATDLSCTSPVAPFDRPLQPRARDSSPYSTGAGLSHPGLCWYVGADLAQILRSLVPLGKAGRHFTSLPFPSPGPICHRPGRSRLHAKIAIIRPTGLGVIAHGHSPHMFAGCHPARALLARVLGRLILFTGVIF